MSELRDVIMAWVDRRMGQMLAAPRMWGSDEAVEMQVLLLLELRALAQHPEQELAQPRRTLEAYAAHIQKAYPAKHNCPLFELVEPDDLGLNLANELRKAIDALAGSVLEDSPLQNVEIMTPLRDEG